MHVTLQWLVNLVSPRSSSKGCKGMDSEKKKKKMTKANREAKLPIRFYIGEHRKKYVVSEELRKSSAYKNFMEAYRGELSFRGGKEPRGLSCTTAEFQGMLALAEAETKGH